MSENLDTQAWDSGEAHGGLTHYSKMAFSMLGESPQPDPEWPLPDDVEPWRFEGFQGDSWNYGDTDSLAAIMMLERRLRTHGVPLTAPAPVLGAIHDRLVEYHGALPFTEIERIQMVTKHYAAERKKPPEEHPPLHDLRAEVFSSGFRTRIDGRNLMRRWWSWRRDAHEFEGQDGRLHARLALGGLLQVLLPPGRERRDTDTFMNEHQER